MHPVAPPTKKQRSSREASQGRDALSTAADDAIARRRAELRRLQQMQSNQQGRLLDQARTQLGAPPMPASEHIARARHSDIFPNVTKMGVAPHPTERPKSMDSRIPTPRVARRLDPAFQEKRERARSAPPMRPPPPARPPPLVAEAPPEQPSSSSRPPPITTTSIQEPSQETNPPSTARRDVLRNLREYADTPPIKQSEDIRLVKELKQAQDEKADALRKVSRLREQIHHLQTQEPATLEVVVQVAEQSGETAAIRWAREQVSNNPQQPPVSQVRTHMICLLCPISFVLLILLTM
jgi:hypothetical protein